jgi:1-acyl-sn-glycerol-3-phosphate acyltransferase
MVYKILLFIIRLFTRLLIKIEIVDEDNIPQSGSYIGVGNHNGIIDVVLVYSYLDRNDIILLVSKKYQKYAIFRWLVYIVDGIFVEPRGTDLNTVREVLRRLEAGGVLAIAPEGTRSADGSLQEGRPGAAYLASKAGVPILPVGGIGTSDGDVKRNLLRFKRLKFLFRVGEPYTLQPIKGPNREAKLQEYTDDMMCRIATLLPPEYRGVYTDHPRLKELLSEDEGSE